MLTAESEGGLLKCHSYWKDHTYGPFNLTPLSERRITLDLARTNPGLRRSTDNNPLNRTRRPSITNRSTIEPESPRDNNAPHVIMRKFTLSHSAHPFSPIREITQLQYS